MVDISGIASDSFWSGFSFLFSFLFFFFSFIRLENVAAFYHNDYREGVVRGKLFRCPYTDGEKDREGEKG